MKTRIKYFYRCWGGIVPSHHCAHGITIEEADGEFTIWENSSGTVIQAKDISEAEQRMMMDYTNVIRTGRSGEEIMSQLIEPKNN